MKELWRKKLEVSNKVGESPENTSFQKKQADPDRSFRNIQMSETKQTSNYI